MTWWAPKPLRPAPKDPLFKVEEAPVVVKGLNPWQRQRLADGTPHTVPGPTALRPPDPEMYIRKELVKGSLAENLTREIKPKTDPDPSEVVKAFLEKPSKEQEEFVEKNQAATARMQAAITALSKSLAKDDDDKEDEEKSISSAPKKASARAQRAGSATVSAATAIPKMVLGSVPKK